MFILLCGSRDSPCYTFTQPCDAHFNVKLYISPQLGEPALNVHIFGPTHFGFLDFAKLPKLTVNLSDLLVLP